MIAQRADEKDTRNRQRLMLTNYKNWSIDTSKHPKGWLKILTLDEFNALKGDTCGNEKNILQHENDDTDIAAELTKPICGTNNTADLTSTTKPAFSLCSAKLTLPPNLLADPAFFIAAR